MAFSCEFWYTEPDMETRQNPQVNGPETLPQSTIGGDVELNKDMAALSYLFVMSVIVYWVRKESAFARFHSKQAMILFVLSILVWFIPVLGRILELIVVAGAVYGFLCAAHGQWKEVPFIGPLARGAWGEFGNLLKKLPSDVKNALVKIRKPRSAPASSLAHEPSPSILQKL
jgi:uncharacterized membrane protein